MSYRCRTLKLTSVASFAVDDIEATVTDFDGKTGSVRGKGDAWVERHEKCAERLGREGMRMRDGKRWVNMFAVIRVGRCLCEPCPSL